MKTYVNYKGLREKNLGWLSKPIFQTIHQKKSNEL